MSIVKLTGNYGYSAYSVSSLAAYSVIDATTASWTLANTRNSNPDADTLWSDGTSTLNTYPFKVGSAGVGLVIKGGTINGEVPLASDWLYTYNNSAALRIGAAPSVTIEDWRIDGVWDAIRIASGTTDFLIDDVYITNARDDAVENDSVLSGTIRDSLFDGVFSGISLGDSSNTDGSNNVITLESTFIRNKSFLYKGEVTHVSPFKANSSAPGTTPDIRIINSVFAIEDPNHESQGRLDIAWDHVIESRGNVFLNLSDTPLPSNYPMPPAGFTILQGQQARDYWQAVKDAWLDNHDGTPVSDITVLPPLPGAAPTVTPPPPPPVPSVVAPSTPTTTSGLTINDSSSSHTINGTAGNDVINGFGGDDKIFGKGGNDILTGGSGRDKFILDTQPGSGSVPTITDFSTRDDYIYLDNAIFTKLGSGSLSSPVRLYGGWFEAGSGSAALPDDSTDYVLYNSDTGALSYDADGSGSGAAVLIANLSPGLDLTKFDIFVV